MAISVEKKTTSNAISTAKISDPNGPNPYNSPNFIMRGLDIRERDGGDVKAIFVMSIVLFVVWVWAGR